MLLVDAALLLAWTLGGLLQELDQFWRGLGWSELWTGVAFLISVGLISSLLDLPASLYRTFSIEERFGFNRTTLGLFISDMVKSMLLSLALGVPLLALILWLMQSAGANWWLWAWGVWFGFNLFLMWAFPAFIAPLFNRIEPLQNDDLKARIERILQRNGFASSGVFVMDGSRRSGHGNAYFAGLGKTKRIVLFDTLLTGLEAEEIEAVLAHEVGHFARRHLQKRLVFMALFSLAGLALLAWLMQQAWFYSALGISQPSTYAALALFSLAMPVFMVFLSPLLAWMSRRHEFEADAFAAMQTNPATLIHALVKMYRENASTLTPDPLYSAFYDSHPPAPARVAHLSGVRP
jgi:STE24 endopeptidase